MQRELGTPGAIVGMVLLALLFATLAAAIYPGWESIGRWMSQTDSPAWVQAVGSIVAIFASGAIAGWQGWSNRREATRQRRRTETSRALAVDYILNRVRLVVANAQRAVESRAQGTLKLARHQVELVQQALRGLPVFEIPSPALVFDLQRVDRDLLYILRLLDEAEKPDGTAPRKTGAGVFIRVQNRIATARFAALSVVDGDAMKEIKRDRIGALVDDMHKELE